MNDLQIFNNKEFGNVRAVVVNDLPWFVGKDVCEAFGDTNYRRSLSNIDESDKGVSQIDTPGGKQNMVVINESGLYSLLFQMQPQKAKGVSQNDALINERIEKLHRFKHWVTSEVLPSIRKNGGYIAGQETMSDEELMAKALLVANNKIAERDKIIEQKQARIEQMKPKEIFADAVATSHTSILVGDLAKLICQNGVQIGQKRLFVWLRDKGYLIKSGSSYNMPTQRYIEQGLFEIKESNLVNPDGSVRITRTPKVTGKGQVYFVNKFLKGDNSVSV
ncbi:MAG: phage antirepressor [Eubacterium sp.]|jgi:anti-repressor protein|nr:MAG TPA: KilAC domain protein [Bacteriophage sp.]